MENPRVVDYKHGDGMIPENLSRLMAQQFEEAVILKETGLSFVQRLEKSIVSEAAYKTATFLQEALYGSR